jgi:drug/metabolite transporter (DMT)-like permease
MLLGQTTPLFLMVMRLLCAGILLLIGSLLFDRPRIAYTNKHGMLFVQKILFGSYLKYMLKYWALLHMSAIKMSLLLYCTPFFMAFFAYCVDKERISLQQLCGLVVAFIGVIPILFVQDQSFFISSSENLYLIPELAVMGAVISHSYGMQCTQQLVKKYEYPATFVSAIGALIGGLLAYVTALYMHDPMIIADKYQFFSGFFVLIFVCNIVCNTWYIRLLKKHSTTFLSLSDYLNPLFVAVYSWFLLGETITWQYGYAALCISCGLYIFSAKKKILQISA